MRLALLRFFLDHPTFKEHPAALARMLTRPPQDVGRVLARLEDEGILKSERVGRTRTYRLAIDPKSTTVQELRVATAEAPDADRIAATMLQRRRGSPSIALGLHTGHATTTVNPLHFEDLDSRAFEDLVRSLLRSRHCWLSLEAIGRSGSDEGRDIEGVEVPGVPPSTDPATVADDTPTRRWVIQVKRHRTLGPRDLERIVDEALRNAVNVPFGLLIATAADPTPAARRAFLQAAKRQGVVSPDLWSRSFIEDELMRPQHAALLWRYFGLGSGSEGTQAMPATLEGSAGRNLPLFGRDEELRRLRHGSGDWIIAGRPGTGKSRLAFEAGGARFLGTDQPLEITESVRVRQPRRLVVDDAGLDPSRLELVLNVRARGLDFDILAVAWPEDVPALRQLLPRATELHLDLLERPQMDALVRAMEVEDYFVRGEILEQAEGRPGWAVALGGAATAGRLDEVLSGRALVSQVESFISRIARDPDATLIVVSALAAMGHAAPDEIGRLGDLLRMPAPQFQRALNDAASGGLLERNYAGQIGWEVRPFPLRHALAARTLFDSPVPALSFDALVQTFPRLRANLMSAAVGAARAGSTVARRQVEVLIESGASDVTLLAEYATIDEATARRAVSIVAPAEGMMPGGLEVLKIAAGSYALHEAVEALLSLGVEDERPMHPNPDHATRVLGDLATQLLPNGRTVFQLREAFLSIATNWLVSSPQVGRQLVWARLVSRLLQPSIEGNWMDLGSHRTAQLYARFESAENLRAIAIDMWPTVERQLSGLSTTALNELIRLVDAWMRLAKGHSGAFDAKPRPEAIEVAVDLAPRMLEAITVASAGRPAVALRIAEVARLLRTPTRVSLPREFRLLTWQPWRWHRHGRPRMDRILQALGRAWAAEDPDAVMTRVRGFRDEAGIADRSIMPAVHVAMESLASTAENLDAYVYAAMRANVCYEAQAVIRTALGRATIPPSWLAEGLSGSCRQAVIYAATSREVNVGAAAMAVGSLNQDDVGLVDQILLGRDAPDIVAQGLLEHPVNAIRGAASLEFQLESIPYGVALPDEWHEIWRNAFLESTPTRGQHAEYQLTELLARLVQRDPELVEGWLMRRLDEGGWRAFHGPITYHSEAIFRQLPIEHRDRLVRRYASAPYMTALLPLLLSPDPRWVESLLDDGVISGANVLMALAMVTEEFETRRPLVEALAQPLIRAGVSPERIAATAQSGSWMGDESTRYSKLIRVFEEMSQSPETSVSGVGRAGVQIFTRERDRALEGERRERVVGI